MDSNMNEIVPGLWIGSLAGLQELATTGTTTRSSDEKKQFLLSSSYQNHNNSNNNNNAYNQSMNTNATMTTTMTNYTETWTIVTLLESSRLIHLSRAFVEKLMMIRQKDPNAIEVKNHIVWELPDRPTATLLDEKNLIPIFDCISQAVASHQDKILRNRNRSTSVTTTTTTTTNTTQSDQQQEQQLQNVLVHCAKGQSRSAAVCAAWLLYTHHHHHHHHDDGDYHSQQSETTSLAQALDKIRASRPSIAPNLGFLASLRALEQTNGDLSKASRRLKSNCYSLSNHNPINEDEEND